MLLFRASVLRKERRDCQARSIRPGYRPCFVEAGNAWWLLFRLSRKGGIAAMGTPCTCCLGPSSRASLDHSAHGHEPVNVASCSGGERRFASPRRLVRVLAGLAAERPLGGLCPTAAARALGDRVRTDAERSRCLEGVRGGLAERPCGASALHGSLVRCFDVSAH